MDSISQNEVMENTIEIVLLMSRWSYRQPLLHDVLTLIDCAPFVQKLNANRTDIDSHNHPIKLLFTQIKHANLINTNYLYFDKQKKCSI